MGKKMGYFFHRLIHITRWQAPFSGVSPNTEVKLFSADATAFLWESRSSPGI